MSDEEPFSESLPAAATTLATLRCLAVVASLDRALFLCSRSLLLFFVWLLLLFFEPGLQPHNQYSILREMR